MTSVTVFGVFILVHACRGKEPAMIVGPNWIPSDGVAALMSSDTARTKCKVFCKSVVVICMVKFAKHEVAVFCAKVIWDNTVPSPPDSNSIARAVGQSIGAPLLAKKKMLLLAALSTSITAAYEPYRGEITGATGLSKLIDCC